MNFVEFTEWYEKKYPTNNYDQMMQAWRESGFATSNSNPHLYGHKIPNAIRLIRDNQVDDLRIWCIENPTQIDLSTVKFIYLTVVL